MVPVTLDNTIGAQFLGCVGASILYGTTNLQVFLYYHAYQNDWIVHKISVAYLWIFDTVNLIVTVINVYHYVITLYGNPAGEDVVFWAFQLQIATNIILILSVQSLYAFRIWKIRCHSSILWPSFIILVMVANLAIGLYVIIKNYAGTTFSGLTVIAWSIEATFGLKTGIDILIAATLCYYLSKGRSGFSSTDTKIQKIMTFVIGSGALTSACSLTALLCFHFMPNNLIWLGVEFLLTKLYVNSFMAMLNARKSINEGFTSSQKPVNSGGSLTVNNFNLTGPARRARESYTGSHSIPDKDHVDLLPMSPSTQEDKRHSRMALGIKVQSRTDDDYDLNHVV